jgi:hypothetical protein
MKTLMAQHLLRRDYRDYKNQSQFYGRRTFTMNIFLEIILDHINILLKTITPFRSDFALIFK